MNIGNSVNNNMNMNLLIPGRRSFPSDNNQTNDNIQNKVRMGSKNEIQLYIEQTLSVFCPFLAGPPQLSDYRAVIDR